MKPTFRLITSRKISLAAASLLSLTSVAPAAPYADANPFERTAFGSDWGILSNDIFFGGADALFGLSPASRTLLLSAASDSKKSDSVIVSEAKKEDLSSFASAVGSPFVFVRGNNLAPNAPTLNSTIVWDGGAGGGTGWRIAGNWAGDVVPDGTDVAQFSAAGTATTIGIDMNAAGGSQSVGAIEIASANTVARTIRNSSTTVGGTLTLNGVTVNAVSNVILRNDSATLLSMTNGTSQVMDVGLGNATDNVVNIDGTGGITISSVIKDGAGNDLTLGGAGTGVFTLLGNNTYTGTTTINAGTLNAGATGALGGTTNVVVNGGTLLFSGATTNRINDAATMTLNGGTLNTAGLSEHGAMNNDAGIGALTLMSSSIIDLGSLSSILAFADSSGAGWTGTLSIWNWSGTPFTGNGTDQLYFGNSNGGLTGTQLGQISFYSDAGTTFLGVGTWGADNDGEVVPVPEPGTWIGAALALAAIGFTQRRRLRSLVARGA